MKAQPNSIPLLLVAAAAAFGGIFSWYSIQGTFYTGRVASGGMPRAAEVEVSATEAPALLAQGERIEQTQCAGCHTLRDRLVGPSYREIGQRYSSLGQLVLASAHPVPGWEHYPPAGAAQKLPEADRLAAAYWIFVRSK